MVTAYNLSTSPSPWKIRGSVFGLFAGFTAPLIGLVLTVVSWFADPAWHGVSLHLTATFLFVMMFPLLLLGAHCLDLLEKENRQAHSHQFAEGETRA
jgi:hypothetical protein